MVPRVAHGILVKAIPVDGHSSRKIVGRGLDD